MILTDQQIVEKMQKPLNGDAVTVGGKLQDNHKVHITGEGYEKLVKQVKGFEGSPDFNVKAQVAKPATIQITSIIIDNLNRWRSAQGTVKKIDFKDTNKNKEFENILSNVWNEKSFDNFIDEFYKNAIYTDFNGFILVTKPKIISANLIEKYGIVRQYNGGNLDPYIIFIAASDVHDFLLSGNKCEYIIFKIAKDTYRIIDDDRDIIIEYKNNKISHLSQVINELGYVPAIKVSTLNHKLLNDQVKTSPIAHVIPALDRYFSSDADLRMQFIKHAYPKLAIVTKPCSKCFGDGYMVDAASVDATKIKCNTCDGTGREIPISRDGVIGLPEYIANEDKAYPGAPATYISQDVESLRICIEDLKAQRQDIIYSATGDKNLVSESLNTATENLINSRSLEDRIAEISSMVETVEIFLKKAIKDLHKSFSSIKDYSITVRYGRRVGIKGETDLMAEIKEAKNAAMPMAYISSLHKDLIYVKYKNNVNELERMMLLSDVEPFAGYSIDELLKITEYINKEDLFIKVNLDSLVDELETTQPLQYIAADANYKERVILIKKQLYEIFQKRFGRLSRDTGESVADITTE